jgi:hypothetical protein
VRGRADELDPSRGGPQRQSRDGPGR